MLWRQFRGVLANYGADDRDFSIMQGFIAAAMDRDPGTANRLLNEAVTDPILGPRFPLLQASMRIDDAGAERLTSSVALGLAPAWTYQELGFGRVADAITPAVYKRIVLDIASLPEGYSVAVDLLGMRLYSLKSEKLDIDQETVLLGQDLLLRFDFRRDGDDLAYHLNEIALACLGGTDAYEAARELCVNFARALCDHQRRAWHYGELAGTLFHLQPRTALDIFLSREKTARSSLLRVFSIDREGPVDCAPPDVLLSWANEDAADRYPRLAREVRLFQNDGDAPELVWTPLALHLLEEAPERGPILEAFSERLRPTSWSGSLAEALTPYLYLVRKLGGHSDPVVAAWALGQEARLMQEIESERQHERRADESFE